MKYFLVPVIVCAPDGTTYEQADAAVEGVIGMGDNEGAWPMYWSYEVGIP